MAITVCDWFGDQKKVRAQTLWHALMNCKAKDKANLNQTELEKRRWQPHRSCRHIENRSKFTVTAAIIRKFS
jgi:hypothetical protein